jgi:hypothetical protein
MSALSQPRTLALELLRWSCFALFLGRAWQHFVLSPPYRAFLWSQELMEQAVLRFLGMDWTTYATSPAVNDGITLAIRVLGGAYLLFAVAALLASSTRAWTRATLWIAAGFVSVLALAVTKDKLWMPGEFFEFACQLAAPMALALLCRRAPAGENPDACPPPARLLRFAVAATFAAHGLYAVGFLPAPGEWTTMIMTILRTGEPTAVGILRAAGWMDFVVALLILTPRADRWAAVYAAAWGLLTALARPLAFVTPDAAAEGLRYWLPEMLVRLPNAAVPAALLALLIAQHPKFSPAAVWRGIQTTPHHP